MYMTAEISMYPIRDDYLPPIKTFIDALNGVDGLLIETTTTCTILRGEYDVIMKLLGEAIAESYRQFGTSVFVTKFIPGYDPDAT
ncbi:MAG: hypothetical protein ACU84Q_15085 [Gammaproteobacteria bacterium]